MVIKIASNIKELREQAGLTQQEIAKALHTTQRKVSYWECGKVEPDISDLWSLSSFFNVTVDFLIGKSDY